MPELAAEGRMTPAGLAAWEARGDANETGYGHTPPDAELPPEYAAVLRGVPGAAEFWDTQPPSYQRLAAKWVVSAKQEETRQRRLAALVDACARGERVRGG